jgi:hypothetical protein
MVRVGSIPRLLLWELLLPQVKSEVVGLFETPWVSPLVYVKYFVFAVACKFVQGGSLMYLGIFV